MIKHKFHLTFLTTELGEPIQFEKISEQFRDIELNPISEKDYELIIGVEKNKLIEESTKEANIKANDLVDRLSLLDNHEVSSLTYIGNSDGDSMSANLTGTSSFTAIATTHIADPLSFYGLENNKVVFKGNRNAGTKRVYRFSLGIKDDISKYLIYYGLLQILVNEEQKELEIYIKKEAPLIPLLKRKRSFKRKGVYVEEEVEETMITRIRNLIAHPNNDFDIQSIAQDVKLNIEILRKLVVNILRNES